MPSPVSLRDRLRAGPPVLLDGATGTELERRGFELARPGWSARALVDAPELLAAIHDDYSAAGAEVLTANTFRLHERNLADWGRAADAQRLCDLAVSLARETAGSRGWVAASLAPVADCYSPQFAPVQAELEQEHRATAGRLANAGADLLLVETMGTIREAVAAAQAARQVRLPFIVSFVTGPAARLLSGEPLAAAVDELRRFEPTALAVNCLSVGHVPVALEAFAGACPDLPWGVYANTGERFAEGWRVTTAAEPAVYAVAAHTWLQSGIRLVGGCCGTTPEHIRALQLVCSQYVESAFRLADSGAPTDRSGRENARS